MTATIGRDTNVGEFESWGFPAWSFDDFHRRELPRRLAEGVNEQVTWDLVVAPPFAVACSGGGGGGGRAYTYVAGEDAVTIEPGVRDDATGVLEIGERAWQDYVHEFRNPSSLVLAEAIRFARGGMREWDRWAPAMRCMYSGREIYDPNMTFEDRHGDPLDLHQTFTLDDDHEDLSHFLRTAGYLVVRGAMAPRRDEIAAEIERLQAEAIEGTIFSWWTDHLDAGHRFPYRLLFMSENSELIRSLMDDDPTVEQLVALAKRDLVPLHDRGQGAVSVLKPFGRGANLGPSIAANLGWHADCNLGGCGIMCPSINIGIHVDAAGPDSSQLWALAGSHGRVPHLSGKRTFEQTTAVPLDTEPGDITIHYSCVTHAGPPPTGTNARRTLYLPFYGPETLTLLGRFQSFEQVLPGYGTGDTPDYFEMAKDAEQHNTSDLSNVPLGTA